MATKARTARKKAVKPVRMWGAVIDGRLTCAQILRPWRKSNDQEFARCIRVLVTPAHKGKP